MASLNHDQTTLHVTRLKECSGWTDWLLPLIQGRALSMMEGMLAGKTESDERTKGFIQALRWVIALPKVTLEEIQRAETEAVNTDDIKKQDEFRSRFGNRSPYKPAPEPGETKMQDDAPPPGA